MTRRQFLAALVAPIAAATVFVVDRVVPPPPPDAEYIATLRRILVPTATGIRIGPPQNGVAK